MILPCTGLYWETLAYYLVSWGVDLEARNDLGETPLHRAVRGPSNEQNVHPGIIHMLLAEGSDIEARNNAGETPLHTSLRKVKEYGAHLGVLVQLLEGGADTYAKTPGGETPCQMGRSIQAFPAAVADLLCGR